MKEIHVITGLSASGKSTLARQICKRESVFQHFGSDQVYMALRALFRVAHFSNADSQRLQKLDSLADLDMARTWLFIQLLQQIRSEYAVTDGYRFLYREDRRSFEQAVQFVFPSASISYILLRPSATEFNRNRLGRGFRTIESDELDQSYLSYDMTFVDAEIGGFQDWSTKVYAKSTIRARNRFEPKYTPVTLYLSDGGPEDRRLVDDVRRIEYPILLGRLLRTRMCRRLRAAINRLIR